MKRYSSYETHIAKSGGKLFEFMRTTDYCEDGAWVEVVARVWTGHQWRRLHHWSGHK